MTGGRADAWPTARYGTTVCGMGGHRERSRRKGPGGALGFAAVPLLVLKLTGVIGWSWWLVLLPLWLPAAVALPFAAVFLMSAGTDRLGELLVRWRIRRKYRHDSPDLWL
jgi:hypothetical protein